MDSSRVSTSSPSERVQVDRSTDLSVLADTRASQPLNTRNSSARSGRRSTESPRVNIPATSSRTDIQNRQSSHRDAATIFRNSVERNQERQRITGTRDLQRDRPTTTLSRESEDLLQRLRQGRSRAQVGSSGVRHYDPVGPVISGRSLRGTNQRSWQSEITRPRVLVDDTYRRHQAQQHRFIRHYPTGFAYYDRPERFDTRFNYLHVYYSQHRLFHQMIWPSFRFYVAYDYGHRRLCRYVYPHYLRKYVFVSLGGYWPNYDDCLRYYWYGWHPYHWYGYDPIPRQVNNYYTYNYYDDPEPAVNATVVNDLEPSPPPPYQGPGDQYFEEGVASFEDGEYMTAANLLRQAMQLDPNDIILPFAYTQALFADKEYLLSVMALRKAMEKIDPNNNTIFYPRGLYTDDETLFRQIDELMSASDQNPQNRNLKLLLGYQLLGIGEIDSAAAYLEQAGHDRNNAQSSQLLLDLIRTVREDHAETKAEIKP